MLPRAQRHGLHAERLSRALQHLAQRVVLLEIAARQVRQRLRLASRPLRGTRSARRRLHRPAHHRRHDEEHDERERLLPLRHVERVLRLHEEVVDEEGGRDRAGDRHGHPADHRHHHHEQQVEQHLALERERLACAVEQQRQQREAEQRHGRAGHEPAPPEAAHRRARRRHRVGEQVVGAHVRDPLGRRGHRSSAPLTHGTLVTVIHGSKSSLAFSRSAVWLWSRFSHQWPTTYSGMMIEMTSPG